jgi:hypothetical protein
MVNLYWFDMINWICLQILSFRNRNKFPKRKISHTGTGMEEKILVSIHGYEVRDFSLRGNKDEQLSLDREFPFNTLLSRSNHHVLALGSEGTTHICLKSKGVLSTYPLSVFGLAVLTN